MVASAWSSLIDVVDLDQDVAGIPELRRAIARQIVPVTRFDLAFARPRWFCLMLSRLTSM